MAFSLYAATVPSYLQILEAISGLITKAEGHCGEKAIAPADLLQARLAADMWPFATQVKAVTGHSLGAIEGVRKGVFTPDVAPAPDTFAGLKGLVARAIAGLREVEPAELDGYLGRDMRFEFGERRIPFTAEDYLLSMAQPNFYFHATTAYDILRSKGVALGKRDFVGKMRMKG